MTKPIKRSTQAAQRFEELKEFVLGWHGAQEVPGKRLIGRTPAGKAVALVWEDNPDTHVNKRNVLTFHRMEEILDEAVEAGLKKPAMIWAEGSTAPILGDLYHFHQLHAGSSPHKQAALRAAITTCFDNNITTVWTDGTGILNGCPFLDAESNRWVTGQQLLTALETNTHKWPLSGKLDWAMTDIGSRKQTFTIKAWTGEKYETREITAWFADCPMENQGP